MMMAKEYRAKVFKSGNSLALRLPKDMGLKEGATMVVREERTGFHMEPEQPPKLKLDVDRFWGKAKGMVHVPEPRQDFEPRPSSLKGKA
jgi:antitoxin VapB